MKEIKEIEIEVTVDNHTHKGKAVKKGSRIKVSEETAEMLKKEWIRSEK